MGRGGFCKNKMKIVFFGTPEYVIPILNKLHRGFRAKDGNSTIVAIVTQKPKLAGRKKQMKYSAVDKWAFDRNIPKYFTPTDMIKDKPDADLGVLASFGAIIPKEVLKFFPKGIINIHPSLLPKFRGASPVQAAIASGEKETGATIIKLDEKLDHGPILTQFKGEIKNNDTTDSLRNRLFEKSADVAVEMLETYVLGKIKPKMQDHKEASFTKTISKSDAFLSPEIIKDALEGRGNRKFEVVFMDKKKFSTTPEFLKNFVNAMQTWPTAWTTVKINNKNFRLKLHSAHVEEKKLVLDKVQLEGKNKVSFNQFTEAYSQLSF